MGLLRPLLAVLLLSLGARADPVNHTHRDARHPWRPRFGDTDATPQQVWPGRAKASLPPLAVC